MTGLEALKNIDEVLCDIEIKYKENLGYTKPLTKTIEKSLKAVQLIKTKSKKNYNLALVVDSGTYEQYCEQFKYFLDDYKEKAGAFEIWEEDKFSFEEYNLLREVFVYE